MTEIQYISHANLMHAAWKVWRDANNKCHINKHSCNLNKSSSGC